MLLVMSTRALSRVLLGVVSTHHRPFPTSTRSGILSGKTSSPGCPAPMLLHLRLQSQMLSFRIFETPSISAASFFSVLPAAPSLPTSPHMCWWGRPSQPFSPPSVCSHQQQQQQQQHRHSLPKMQLSEMRWYSLVIRVHPSILNE